jgi:hypothetical protein
LGRHLCMLVTAQFVFITLYAPLYLELARIGAAPLWCLLTTLVGCGALYAATLRVALRGGFRP